MTDQKQTTLHFGYLVGESPAMKDVYETLEKVIPTELHVVVRGETGTGKELVARAIHENGPRSGEDFVAVNCSRFSGTLLESELFGHASGAFTGASEDRIGLLEQADGGTLVLDEVAEMGVDVQAKLLRSIEENRIRRLGENRERDARVRIISTTGTSLKSLIEEGSFREDLYYRLREASIRLPRLEERREDIPLLVRHVLDELAEERGEAPKQVEEETLEFLAGRSWPGNVRQLRNTVRQMAMFAGDRNLVKLEDKQRSTILEQTRDQKPGSDDRTGDRPVQNWHTLLPSRKREKIREALEKTGGNKKKAAELLGISRMTLYRHLKGEEEEHRDQGGC